MKCAIFALLSPSATAIGMGYGSSATNLAMPGPGQVFTTNQICRKSNCVNPIFPGLESIDQNAAKNLTCFDSSIAHQKNFISFCKDVAKNNFALERVFNGSADGEEALLAAVAAADAAAASDFFYHHGGIGIDPWQFESHDDDTECSRAIREMVCFTHFPSCTEGVEPGQPSEYLKPCASTCHNYIQKCGVECCDESVQCVFENGNEQKGNSHASSGYISAAAPACTAPHASLFSSATSAKTLMALVLPIVMAGSNNLGKKSIGLMLAGALAIALQGCSEASFESSIANLKAPHNIGMWESLPNYLEAYEYIFPGEDRSAARLNSCADGAESDTRTVQCSGHGTCKYWGESQVSTIIPTTAAEDLATGDAVDEDAVETYHAPRQQSFCYCDPEWADPECSSPRRSQLSAFYWSLFLGVFGADQFYLGYPVWGCAKLASLGGLGVWWAYDVIRIGSAPVQSQRFDVAADLTFAQYYFTVIFFAIILGTILAALRAQRSLRQRRKRDMDMFAAAANSEMDVPGAMENSLKQPMHPQQYAFQEQIFNRLYPPEPASSSM